MRHVTSSTVLACRNQRGLQTDTVESLAEETPIAFVYNGHPHAVMMATPSDLEDLAIGFTLTEGIVEDPNKIEIIDCLSTVDGISLQMLIPQARADALDVRERNMTGRTGCGLCGAGTLAAAIRPVRQIHTDSTLSLESLFDGFLRLERSQPLNHATGAVHAAAVICSDGEFLAREDVGRHNAIDKVFGAAARSRVQVLALLVTSRASYEVVHKAAQAGCSIVAAISAPTALAVRLAEQAGVTLVGFARAPRATIYANPQRIIRSLKVDASVIG